MSGRNNSTVDQYFVLRYFVIFIVSVLVAALVGATSAKNRRNAYEMASVGKQRSIILTFRTYAADWDGHFYFPDPVSKELKDGIETPLSSADIFNVLIPDYIDSEILFWQPSENPKRNKPPVENNHLTSKEISFGFLSGLKIDSGPNLPLVFEGEMLEPGVFNRYHPGLDFGVAILGYTGGHVKMLRTSTNKEGAIIQSEVDRKDYFKYLSEHPELNIQIRDFVLP